MLEPKIVGAAMVGAAGGAKTWRALNAKGPRLALPLVGETKPPPLVAVLAIPQSYVTWDLVRLPPRCAGGHDGSS
jgi:hypothetical protein